MMLKTNLSKIFIKFNALMNWDSYSKSSLRMTFQTTLFQDLENPNQVEWRNMDWEIIAQLLEVKELKGTQTGV